jgi:hypothetical protein
MRQGFSGMRVTLTEADFTSEFCHRLVDEHGKVTFAAKAIAPQTGRAWRTVACWISKHCGPRRIAGGAVLESSRTDGFNRLVELLDKAGVKADAIGSIDSVKLKAWGAAMKLKKTTIDPVTGKKVVTEQPHELGLHATNITLRPNIEFPLVQQAAPKIVRFERAPAIVRKTRTVVVLSDAQIGFLRDNDTDQLEPIHDPAAMAVAKQIVAAVQPNELDFIGDWVDWPTFSRWPQHPEMRRTLQQSIDAGHTELAEFISAAGKQCGKKMMIGSNHGYRPEKFILEHNLEAVGVKRAHAQPEEWPVFSEPYLLRYDELGIEFSGQYPGGAYFLLPDLGLIHAPPKILEYRATMIHGHTHKRTLTPAVQHGHEGQRFTHYLVDVGCMCQLGATSNLRRLMITRVPSDRGRTNWQQGIAVVEIIDAHGSRPAKHAIEQVEIDGGEAIFRGQVYRAKTSRKAH